VLRREAATGLCLEALLGEKLRHPNVISTLAWAVVTGKVSLLDAHSGVFWGGGGMRQYVVQSVGGWGGGLD
jgi:hypothetical protein